MKPHKRIRTWFLESHAGKVRLIQGMRELAAVMNFVHDKTTRMPPTFATRSYGSPAMAVLLFCPLAVWDGVFCRFGSPKPTAFQQNVDTWKFQTIKISRISTYTYVQICIYIYIFTYIHVHKSQMFILHLFPFFTIDHGWSYWKQTMSCPPAAEWQN